MNEQDWAMRRANSVFQEISEDFAFINQRQYDLFVNAMANAIRQASNIELPTEQEVKQAEALRSAQIETNYDPHAFTAGALWAIRQIKGEENG